MDLSTYSTLPVSADLAMQITPPGWPTINVPFNPGQVNVYRCGDLGITCPIVECCPLPDGIYSVSYTVRFFPTTSVSASTAKSSTFISKTFIKVDQLDCRLDNLFLKIDQECDCPDDTQKKYKRQYREACLLRDGAVAAANDCDDLLAYKLYGQANTQVDCIYASFCPSCTPIPSCEQCN
ncbi:MAG: hypothetical protein E6R03_17665 [Hyphomicrobiaceae bacterium]|nr:MAG: hypothetical protein E6R03_17665 [Hyphomicrobiaceae bacterium]